MKKKIAVFGCKKTTKYLLEHLVDMVSIDQIISIDSNKGSKMQVADYYDISDFAKEKEIPLYVAEKYALKSETDLKTIAGFEIDVAFVIGWQRLIPAEVLNSFKIGAFGMHGSSMNLPLGRGRSPMNWSIIEGRRVFSTNLFKYDPGVDSGDVVDTVKFQVLDTDTGATMHFKNALSMKFLVTKNLEKLLNNKFTLTKQRTDLKPTYYPKRTSANGLIDWNQDIVNIERLIRAVTKPFDGAYSFIRGNRISIFRSQIFDHLEFGLESEREGTIVEVFNEDHFLVKCFGGLLLVSEWESDYYPQRGDIFDNGLVDIEYFKINKHGFFDISE